MGTAIWIIIIVIIIAMTGSGLFFGKNKRPKDKTTKHSSFHNTRQQQNSSNQGSSNANSINHFETSKSLWYANMDKTINLGNGIYEQISEFPFFSKFTNLKDYLNSANISFRKMGEAEELLNSSNNSFRDIFDQYERMLVTNFNELGVAQNEASVRFLTNYYLDFLDKGYSITMNLFYKGAVNNIIDYAFDRKQRSDLYINTKIKQQYENSLADLVNDVVSEIYDELNGTFSGQYGSSSYSSWSGSYYHESTNNNYQENDNYQNSFYENQTKDELTLAYETLEVTDSNTNDEIKKAYKKLALKYHPDRNKTEEAKQKMVKINAAYTLIKQTRGL